jgi:hypothetical protein
MLPPCCLPLRVPMRREPTTKPSAFAMQRGVALEAFECRALTKINMASKPVVCLHNAAGTSGSICNAGHCCVSSVLYASERL